MMNLNAQIHIDTDCKVAHKNWELSEILKNVSYP